MKDLDKLRSQLADSQAELAEKSKRIGELETTKTGWEAAITESEARITELEATKTLNLCLPIISPPLKPFPTLSKRPFLLPGVV